MAKRIQAIINPLTRAPIIQTLHSGKNASSNPSTPGLKAIRNPLARQKI